MTWSVSYTQYAMHHNCPQQYKLKYIDNLSKSTSSIHTIFGTAMHEVIQAYLTTMFERTQKAADELDLCAMLLERMQANFVLVTEREGVKPCPKEEFIEFYEDGLEILKWFAKEKNRLKYYTKRGWQLLGIEVPLVVGLKKNVRFKAYLDIVLKNKDTKRVKIIDLKTSTKGWNKYAKADQTKKNQLLLYKAFYAEQFEIDPEMIDVEFHIIKRRLYKDIEFQQHHFQRFVPAYGKISTKRAVEDFETFVDMVFDDDGAFRTDIPFRKNPGVEFRNCMFCEFSPNNLGLCDQKES